MNVMILIKCNFVNFFLKQNFTKDENGDKAQFLTRQILLDPALILFLVSINLNKNIFLSNYRVTMTKVTAHVIAL